MADRISSYWRTNIGGRVLLFIIVCTALLFFLANLGNQYLWQDEAETALVSKTILTDGVPRGYDGKNFFSQDSGNDYGDNYIWRRHTWLPFYVLAGFYKVFGVSTFVSRLPFALFGAATILATYFFAKALWPGRIPVITAALLTVSVPFLLLCRQCRYYSMAMFFSILSLYAYVAILNRRKYATLLLFIASTLLFHSQHFYVAVLFITILLHAAIFRRNRLMILLLVIIAAVLVNGSWLIWLAGMKHQQTYGAAYRLSLPALIAFAMMPLKVIIHYVFPLWLLVVVAIIVITRRIKKGRFFPKDIIFWERLLLLFFFIVFNVIAIAVASPFPFFRYAAPSIPLLIMLIAIIVDAAGRIHPLLAIATIAILLATSQLKDFFYEITHDFDGPGEGMALYLNEHGSPDDVVAIAYGDLPLKFYTKMRIIGGLTGEDLEPAKNARWVIIRSHIVRREDEAVREYLLKNINWNKYRKIVLNYPDTPWANREEPPTHYFRTRTNEDRVVLYEKID
jgi:4-amino-4-deoxy-L-arabinose transferase-like glycosyltransferase